MDYDLDIVTVLDAETSLTAGVDLFAGKVRGQNGDIPHAAVFVTRSGGGTLRPLKSSDADPTIEEVSPLAQIRVRGNTRATPTAFSDAESIAWEVFNTLNCRTEPGYCEWKMVSGGPLYIGEDDDGRDEWSMNLQVTYDA